MSPKRGDRAAPPPIHGEWDIRFDSGEAAKGWEELCQQAPHNTRTVYDAIRTQPRPEPPTSRHHQLKEKLAHATYADRILEQKTLKATQWPMTGRANSGLNS